MRTLLTPFIYHLSKSYSSYQPADRGLFRPGHDAKRPRTRSIEQEDSEKPVLARAHTEQLQMASEKPEQTAGKMIQ
jgi:hypothetical protein